jgi:UDP-GlcNAc:undecaprenyl-phosphate/decaprenyl-phosphate GlcNAc-1-phosphate transferase
MDQILRIIFGFLLAAGPAIILCRIVMSLGIVDGPTEARKTQPAPVPTAGGIAVALSVALAISVDDELISGDFNPMLFIVGGGALGALIIGVLDDVLGLRASLKLLGLIVVGVAVAWLGPRPEVFAPWPGLELPLPVWVAIAGSALWMVVVMNAVNFMDGANGLSMGMAAIASAGCCVVASVLGKPDVAVSAAALTGGLCGFLVWNMSGKLFAGDAGALAVGALLAGLSLEIVREWPQLVLVPVILLMPFLSDVFLTLIWRVKHGKNLFEAHRDHVYQIALKANLKHWQVSAVHAVWALNAAIVAILAALLQRQLPVILFVLLLAVSTWLHLKVRSAGVRNGLVGKDIA